MPRPEINGEFWDFGTPEKRSPLKAEFAAFMGTLQGIYRVWLEPKADQRTTRQNSFYFAICQRLAKHLSGYGAQVYTATDIHEHMKGRYLMRDLVNHRTGEIVGQFARSTTRLSKAEFTEFADRVQGDIYTEYDLPPLDPSMYGLERVEVTA